MRLDEVRAGRPPYYPDQAIYAAFACAAFGLRFEEVGGEPGLLFAVSSGARSVAFGSGRCSYYPQNTATAATLAADKFFTNALLQRAGVANLGGDYFFLGERHRAHRPPGHERGDAIAQFRALGGRAFVKPLQGSRGDFAQRVDSEAVLDAYLADVARHHDAVLMQPVFTGVEYRVFVINGEVLYAARKAPPWVTGDGRRSVRDLLADNEPALRAQGVALAFADADFALDIVPSAGATWPIPGRMNRSAGGVMTMQTPDNADAVFDLARRAVAALGLRLGAVDLFTAIEGGDPAPRVIEVNANPSIRFLEDSGRHDLILAIWRHTFSATGLL